MAACGFAWRPLGSTTNDENNVISRAGMFALAAGLIGISKGDLAMSTKVTLARLAVLFATVSVQNAALAQTYFPAFPAAANGQSSQTVNRLNSKIPSNARAQATSPSRPRQQRWIQYRAPNRVIRDETAY